MEINYFKRILMTTIAVAFFTTMFALPEHVYLIGGPVNKNNPDWQTSQKVELTKDAVNPSVFHYKGYLAYNLRGDERGNLKFLIADNFDYAFRPNTTENQPLIGTTPMRQDGIDTKWFIPADRSGDGYYELTLNAEAMTLSVDLFRHDLNPEKIYAVGASLPCGWNNVNPVALTRTSPEVAVYTWTGIMSSGDFKFLNPLSIGNWDFGYSPTTPNEAVSFGVAQNIVFEVRFSAETSFNDYKFIMNETAECTITVDLVKKTMLITKNGELKAKNIWITGTAIPGGIAKLVSDNIDPLIEYHYYGELLLGEFKFATTETVDATTKFYVPASASDAISNDVSVSLTSDEAVSGWSVTQANVLNKIKLNSLTSKYKGWIFGIEHIYIVGGATAAGWDAGNPIELTRGSGTQANVFTFDGNLTINTAVPDPNKFKFLLQKDWGTSFHPQFENESIVSAKYFTDHRSDDYKWIVDENKQGHYIIKLDALEETIETTYYPVNTSLANINMNINVFGKKGKIVVKSEVASFKTMKVFGIDGREIKNVMFTYNAEIDLPNGIYIVKVKEGNSSLITTKVSVFQ